MRIHPFSALRPPPDKAAEVACVPYDVVDTHEARAIANRSPDSFMRVIRPEVDLPEGTSPYDDRVYDGAKAALDGLRQRGTLEREAAPCFYVYTQHATIGARQVRQTGLVACCHIDDYLADKIKKHENTHRDKEDDRTRHVLTLAANAGPVFLTYRRVESVATLVQQALAHPPLFDFVADDGVRHIVHRVEETEPLRAAFEQVDVAYVADGHHRTASAARAGARLRQENPAHTGDEEYNWFLAVLFAADELHILPYHRIVTDLHGLSDDAFLQALQAVGRLEAVDTPEPAGPGCFGVYLAGQWWHLTIDSSPSSPDDVVASLDYVILYERVLAPVLGVGDIRADRRVDFVGGIRGTNELERRVDAGQAKVAFAMQSTTMAQLMAVADAGEIMPPKSTWFEPKLRSGLLIHTLDHD
ncbi:MAG: DUF1015 domain-containing protein [Myxococcales bacterium FL481]|nr:MAG: DUF1015 domain-containing protein [Myxococcales bacterium FL481]